MNSLTIVGHVARDAEVRNTPNDVVATFSVGDSQWGKDSKGNEKKPIFWRVALFGKRAEILSQYLVKGTPVTVVGTVSQSEYIDKDGITRQSFDVRATDVALQGKPSGQAKPAPKQDGGFGGIDDSDIPF